MSLDCFLRQHPSPDEESIRDLLNGHLCRCTGYTPIVRAAIGPRRNWQIRAEES